MKLTEWFPHDVKPARPGVYMRGHRDFFGSEYVFPYPYCYFDGDEWLGIGLDPDDTISSIDDRYVAPSFNGADWRGLAEKP